MDDKKVITDSDFLYNQDNHENCVYYNGKYVDYDGLDIDKWLKNNSLNEVLKELLDTKK